MKIESKNKIGHGNKNAQSALADINAQIAALTQQKTSLAQPLKDVYGQLRAELLDMERQIRELDPAWKPEPMKPKAETKIAEILTAKGQPMAADEVIVAVGDMFTPWKVKTVLKKRSTGAKAIFTLADGKYSVKAAAA